MEFEESGPDLTSLKLFGVPSYIHTGYLLNALIQNV